MKTIIVLHGWKSSSDKWQNIKQGLEKQGLRVFVPDLPGFKPENQLARPWKLGDYVEWVKERYGRQAPFILLSHSFGGRVAIKLAAKYPELLSGLILVSAAGIKRASIQKSALAWLSGTAKKASLQKCPLWPFCRKIFYRFVLRKTDWLETDTNPALRETMRLALEEDLTSCLSDIKTPTLIIWGQKDKSTPLKDGKTMSQKIPNSRLEVLKEVGHAPYLECPEAFIRLVAEFTARLT